MSPPDEPTGSELQRLFTLLREDMRDGFAQLRSELRGLVSDDHFTAYQRHMDQRLAATNDDIADVKRQMAEDAQQRREDRRTYTKLWITAVLSLIVSITAGAAVTVIELVLS